MANLLDPMVTTCKHGHSVRNKAKALYVSVSNGSQSVRCRKCVLASNTGAPYKRTKPVKKAQATAPVKISASAIQERVMLDAIVGLLRGKPQTQKQILAILLQD